MPSRMAAIGFCERLQLYSEWRQNAVLPAEEFIKINEGDNLAGPYSYYDPFKQARIISPEYGGQWYVVVKGFHG